MSVLIRFAPDSSTTAEQYDESIRRLEQTGEWPPEGMDYHVCFQVDGDIRVSEIWDSAEQARAFGDRLMPVLKEIGIDPGEPEMIEIHNVIKR